MESYPPEHTDPSQRNDDSPQSLHDEPRLLTRDGERADTPQPASRLFSPVRQLPVRLRQHRFRALPSIQRLRARLAKNVPAVRERRTPQPKAPRARASRLAKRAVFAPLALLGAAVLCLLLFALFLRHDMTTNLPQVDGELHLAGLGGPVTVSRDDLGVPTIRAANTSDLLFAQGFVTAQDRLWQMDALRRHGSGELAAILGPSLLQHDKQQRILQLRAAADRAVLTLPPTQLAELQAYARGVNAYLETHADRLPLEFHLLHYQPAPWTPRDTLLVSLVMFQDLSTSFPGKLQREAFARHMPPDLLADLYPTASFRDQPPAQPQPDLTTPKEVLQIPLDQSQVKLRQEEAPLADLPAAPEPSRCPECRSGSNNWAVSGEHTASGKPMISNDMHLALSVPDIWYEATLHIAGSATEPAMDVCGFTLPGTPFVIVGRNAHVAWSVTNLGGDVQDIHIEHTRGSGENEEFEQADGSWARIAHHPESIQVRGGRNRTIDVLTTQTRIGDTVVETPVITPLLAGEKRTLSLLWTAYDPHTLSSPFGAVDAAASGSAVVASFANFGGPSLNLVYADDAGHIGYHAIGRIPIRGTAEHRPRAQAEPSPAQTGAPAADEPAGEPADTEGTPQALLSFAPHLLQAGFAVRRDRHVHSAPSTRPARGTRAQRKGAERRSGAERKPREERRVRAGRRHRGSPKQEVPVQTTQPASVATAAQKPVLAASPALDYTIGSPIPVVPIDALDRSVQWSGYVPFQELPAITDPADGVLATANARITTDGYPYTLSNEWAPPYRTERIRKLLVGRTGLKPEDMLAVQTDSTSAFDRVLAQRLAYALDHVSAQRSDKDKARLQNVANMLRGWDGNMTPNSAAAAVVTTARAQIWSLLLRPRIAQHDGVSPNDASVDRDFLLYQWTSSTVALENLITLQPARWLPSGYTNWDELLADSVQRSLASGSAPRDPEKWKYSDLHTLDIEHPVLSMSPLFARMLGVRAGTGSLPIAGDGTTILATGHSFGPSERFTADLGDPANTTADVTTGQSGNPRSEHYMDQFQAWLHGSTFALPLGGAPAQHTLRLLP